MLHGFQALGYLTRDQTQALALKALSPNHWTTREIPKNGILEAKHRSQQGFLPVICCGEAGVWNGEKEM